MYADEFNLIKKDFFDKVNSGGTLRNFTLIKIINFSEKEYELKSLIVDQLINTLDGRLTTIKINVPKYYLEENEIEIDGNEKLIYNSTEYKIQGKFEEGKFLVKNKKTGKEMEDYISLTLLLSELNTVGWTE